MSGGNGGVIIIFYMSPNMRTLFMVDRRHNEEEIEHNGRDERYEYTY